MRWCSGCSCARRCRQKYGDSFVAYLAVGLWPLAGVCRERYPQRHCADFAVALITKTALPRVGALSVVLVTFALNWLALTVIVLLFAARFSVHLSGILFSLPTWFALGLTAIGLAWIVSTAQVLVRDIEGMLGPLFMLLSFVCGIQYGLDSIPAAWRDAVLANPFTHAIARLHDTYLGRMALHWRTRGCWRARALVALLGYASSAAWRRMWMTTYE